MLDYAKRTRSHKFTRVGVEAYDILEERLRKIMREFVMSQPSKGKTIK